MRRRSAIWGLLALALASVPLPAPASQNPIVTIRSFNPEGRAKLRRLCARLRYNPKRYLAEAAAGQLDRDALLQAVTALQNGDGCPQDPKLAFEILDHLIPDPIPPDPPQDLVWQMAELSGASGLGPAHPRLFQIAAVRWLLKEQDFLSPADTPAPDRLRSFLVQPGYWEAAVARFGIRHEGCGGDAHPASDLTESDNPDRDAMVLDAMTDRASPRFNLAQAAQLVGRAERPTDRARVAELLLDPAIGPPDRAAAAALMSFYSPYRHFGLTPEQMMRIQQIGEPLRNIAGPTTPDLPQLVVLDMWPASLQPIDLRSILTIDDYPARARRDEATGAVQPALLFGPDGVFSELKILRTSGSSDLDEQTTRLILRRAGTRLKAMHLEGFAGRPVLVPLPAVEWHITSSSSDWLEGVRTEPGKIMITERMLISRTMC